MGTLPRVLVVLPTAWDRRQLAASATDWRDLVEVVLGTPDEASCVDPFDLERYVEAEAGRRDIDGCYSSSDYPGVALAAAIDEAAARPGMTTRDALRAAHKLVMRETLAPVLPAAMPRFAALDTRHLREPLGIELPAFVKPVKGAFSAFTKRFDDERRARDYLSGDDVRGYVEEYLAMFNRLWARYVPDDPRDGRYFLAEGILTGQQVTVEGYVERGQAHVIGIVDSHFHAGTASFSRFTYPSALPDPVQARMVDIAHRAALALRIERSFFNVELMWDERTDRIGLIEVNPRICGQFCDLYAKVDGRSSLAAALELAAGQPVRWPVRRGEHSAAASVPLRLFEPARCERSPSRSDIERVERAHPGTLVWSEIEAGYTASDFTYEDGASFRYAVINLGAPSLDEIAPRAAAIETALGYRFEPPR